MSSELMSPYELTPAWLSWASSGMAVTLAVSGVLGSASILPVGGEVSSLLLSLALVSFLLPFSYGTVKWFNMYSVTSAVNAFRGTNVSLTFSLTYPVHFTAAVLLLGSVFGVVPLAIPVGLFIFATLTSVLFPAGIVIRNELEERQEDSAPDERLN